jgi:UDP:flavonoid glycosyltransferase YjiC (YdhE family)
VSRVLIVATAGAGGDLQPLVAAALALRQRGHETLFVGDRTVQSSLRPLGIAVELLPPGLDLGPRLVAAIREAMAASGGDLASAGPMVQERLTAWATETASPVAEAVRESRAQAVLTSLFGVEVLDLVAPPCPWAVINSTFYVGPNPPRPLEEDFGPRAIPLISRYASLLGSADLVLHATDPVFDFSFAGLPAHHSYVGPLGIWEPPREPARYLDEPGDPWVLVTISSQRQDDLPLAEAALTTLAARRVRVVVTLGPDHAADEITTVPANARLERTVSHAAVLERAALMVSHGGHGSVMKALWYGRPMVLIPWGRDQPGVAARAAALGVAEVLPQDHTFPKALAAGIDRAFTDEQSRDTAARHRDRLRRTDPQGTAASLLETIL